MGVKKKNNRRAEKRQGLNFVITLVTLSLIFGFIGYLIPQYAVQRLRDQKKDQGKLAGHEALSPVATAPPPAPPPDLPVPAADFYRVQAGVFASKANADRLVSLLQEAGYEALITAGPPYKVQAGVFSSAQNAHKLAEELRQRGFEAIVVP